MTTTPNAAPTAAQAHAEGEIEVLTFELQGEIFALEATLVREILDMSPLTAVPGAQRFASAVINFRGKVIPLADLRIAFGMPAEAATIDSRIVVIEIVIDGTPTLVGLLTDRVHEVTTLDLSNSEPPPSIGMRWRPDYIRCLVKRSGQFVILPSLDNIFASPKRGSKPQLVTAA
ncbi:MAG: chemotaxis protein CheW [Hyphomicrobiaceae bacterium]|nr:chemotaxis protein CheW [Hyphomicrobiaceae bacterium]